MINWILQKNLTKPDVLNRIKNALKGEGESYEEVEIIPFSNEIPRIENMNAFKVVYGSTTFMVNAYEDPDFREGVFYNPDTFQMANYVKQWHSLVLNHEGQMIKFGEVSNLHSTAERKWFVRPNHDGKEFAGRVLTFQELVEWSDKICKLDLPDLNKETQIWISEPKAIEKEWRLFIVDNHIITASRYMYQGELSISSSDIPEEMLAFTRKLVAMYKLHDVYVMDIAKVDDIFKLIECNCFNGTGFYDHNIEKVIKAVNEIIRKKYLNRKD